MESRNETTISEVVDNILNEIYIHGKRWIFTTYVILGIFVGSAGAWHMYAIAFIGGLPRDYHCQVDINQSIPQIYKDGKWVNDKCHMYKNVSLGNETIPCNNGWTYYTDYDSTIVTEWDLVCDKDYLPQIAQTIFVVGTLVGAGFISPLADWLGRKKVLVGSQVALAIVGVVTIFSPNYITFVTLRFLSGILHQSQALPGVVAIFELFPKKSRTGYYVFFQTFWSTAVGIMAVFAYFVRNWKYCQLIISIPGFLAIVELCLISETLPWLIARGKNKQAAKIIRKATKDAASEIESLLPGEIVENPEKRVKNGSHSLEEMSHLNGTPPSQSKPHKIQKRETLWDVMKHPKLRWQSLIMWLMWINASMGYYGISLSATTLVGDRYLNFALIGLVEIPATIVVVVAASKIGRRLSSCFGQIGGGSALIIVAFIPKTLANGTSLAPLIVTFNMIGMFFMSCAFTLAFIYGQELYPTSARNSGLGVCSMWARVGGMLAPFAGYMIIVPVNAYREAFITVICFIDYWMLYMEISTKMTKVYWFPGTFLGCLSILTGLLVLYLPEPLGHPIPQKISDMDSWTRKPYRPNQINENPTTTKI